MISLSRLNRIFRGWMNRHLPMMITCAQMDAFLVDYLDGTLSAHRQRRVTIHVRLCKDCNCFLKAYRATVALARSTSLGSAPQGAHALSIY